MDLTERRVIITKLWESTNTYHRKGLNNGQAESRRCHWRCTRDLNRFSKSPQPIADATLSVTAIVTDIKLISKNQREYRFIEALRLLPYPEAF